MLKRKINWFIILAAALLVINLICTFIYIKDFNILSFILLVIFTPCILSSVVVASISTNMPSVLLKNFANIVGALLHTVIIYVILLLSSGSIAEVLKNTEALNSDNLSVSNITYNDGLGSYVFIFLLMIVLTVLIGKIAEKTKGSK